MCSCENNFNGNIVVNSTASFDPSKITITSTDLSKLGVSKLITGDSVTFNLTPLVGGDGVDGIDGREIELQKSATHIEWRYVGASNVWNQLVPLSEITGEQGIQGIQGIQGQQGIQGLTGNNGSDGEDGLSIIDATINGTGNLIITLSDATTIDAGIAKGEDGIDGSIYEHPNHTGDITSMGDGSTSITNGVVTNSKLAIMGGNTIKGRITSSGESQDLTPLQVRTIINVQEGATKNSTSDSTKITISSGGAVSTGSNIPLRNGNTGVNRFTGSHEFTSSIIEANDGSTINGTWDTAQGLFYSNRIALYGIPTPPSSTADSSGMIGEFRYDDNYFYVKTSAGWKQVALSTF